MELIRKQDSRLRRMPRKMAATVSMFLLGLLSYAVAQDDDLSKQYHQKMLSAMLYNDVAQVKALLKTPYVKINDPNYPSSYLADACVDDAASDHSEMVKVLLDAGADVKWHNSAGSTLFNVLAINARQHPTLGILIDALKKDTGGVSTPAFKAVINMQAQLGNTALYNLLDRASPNNEDDSLFVARLLIETAKADPNIPGHLNMTPLALARLKHLDRLASYLQGARSTLDTPFKAQKELVKYKTLPGHGQALAIVLLLPGISGGF